MAKKSNSKKKATSKKNNSTAQTSETQNPVSIVEMMAKNKGHHIEPAKEEKKEVKKQEIKSEHETPEHPLETFSNDLKQQDLGKKDLLNLLDNCIDMEYTQRGAKLSRTMQTIVAILKA